MVQKRTRNQVQTATRKDENGQKDIAPEKNGAKKPKQEKKPKKDEKPKQDKKNRKDKRTKAQQEEPQQVINEDNISDETKEKPKKKSRKALPHNAGMTLYNLNVRKEAPKGNSFKIISWNLAGIRAAIKKNEMVLHDILEEEKPDVLCIQETKIQEKDIEKLRENSLKLPQEYLDHQYWSSSSEKLGYAGTLTISKKKPVTTNLGIGIKHHDLEGRVIAMEFEGFILVNVYVPNSGEGLKRLDYRIKEWDICFCEYLKNLEKKKPLVITGDFNCAREAIDIHSPRTNLKSAGFTQEERDSFKELFMDHGFIDTFRFLHPTKIGYTYFSRRLKERILDKGWRLDYFLVSKQLEDRIHDNFIRYDLEGSDHTPIGLILRDT